jgi:hypothetical protein
MLTEKKLITEFHASSLVEAFQMTLDWTTKANDGGQFWFRGVNNSTLDLEPGSYWRSNYEEFGPLLDFVQEGGAFATIGELDDWKTYYLAQHHGIPTRLLDWTESFSAALFFALDNWNDSNLPCVWIVRPECINQLSIGWEGLVTPEQNKELECWLPKKIKEGQQKIVDSDGQWVYDSSLPLAIYPRKGNSRMIAQQGAFTIHGTKRIKLNEWIVESSLNHDKIICKVVLKGLPKEEALRQLSTLGVRRHTMYPDLANYVSYLRETWGW